MQHMQLALQPEDNREGHPLAFARSGQHAQFDSQDITWLIELRVAQ